MLTPKERDNLADLQYCLDIATAEWYQPPTEEKEGKKA